MTLLALGLAVNIPEGRLHAILEGLVRSGQVRRRGTISVPGPRTAHYHLATGRHSASAGVPTRRVPRERAAQAPEPSHDRARDRVEPYQPALRPAPVTPTGLRSSRAHGI